MRVVALLREARENAGLSQADLAAKLGRGESSVSKLERGAQGIEVVELVDDCRAVGVRVSDLLGGLDGPRGLWATRLRRGSK